MERLTLTVSDAAEFPGVTSNTGYWAFQSAIVSAVHLGIRLFLQRGGGFPDS